MSLQKKANVLVCAYSCISESGVPYPGGEAELGWNIVKQLSRFYNVFVVTHAYNQKAIELALHKDPLPNITLLYIKLPRFFSFLESFHKGGIQIYAYLWQIHAYFSIKKLHQKINFDMFHHVTYANDWMASYMGALLPIPYIRGPGGGAHKIPANFLAEYSFKERFLEKLRSVGQWLFRRDPFFIMGQHKAKAILVCNQEAFDALSASSKKKAHFFPVNGISPDTIPYHHKSHDDFIVVTAGKLLKLKRFDLAIRAFKLFHDKVPNAKLVIAGDGLEFPHLQKLVSDLNLQTSVEFKKWVPHKELQNLMAQSSVFLFTSLRDGGGAVVVEAMAAGLPVVCFDIAGPGFHIQPAWGIKIKPENQGQALNDLAAALEKLYTDNSVREALANAARKRAEEFYAWDKLGETLHSLYGI